MGHSHRNYCTWINLLISGGIKRRRLGECAPVYLAAVIMLLESEKCAQYTFKRFSLFQVLEYMTAELVEAAGLQAKKAKVKNKKQGVLMISPSHIVQAVSEFELMKPPLLLQSLIRSAKTRTCRWC